MARIGADDLADLGKAFKVAGNGAFKKELAAEIRAEGKPVVADVRASARSILPKRGGLAERVAKFPVGVRTRMSGPSAGVRIAGRGERLDSGIVRHPVLGNRENWVEQAVPEGYFTNPVEKSLPRFRSGVERAITNTRHKIERST